MWGKKWRDILSGVKYPRRKEEAEFYVKKREANKLKMKLAQFTVFLGFPQF